MSKQFWFLLFAGVALSVIFLSAGGCRGLSPNNDEESPFEAATRTPDFVTEDGRPKLIMDCAIIGHDWMIPVHGFGLVVDLPGTGGNDIQSPIYQMVYDDMNRMRVSGIRSILAGPDTAVVAVTGYMRPGIQTDDRFDVQIVLPPDTNTRSLRGGRLMETRLSERMGGVGERRGDTVAIAAGPIMVDDVMATETNNPGGLQRGTILSGAVARQSRSLSLLMRENYESIIMTDRIARAINHRFPIPNPTGMQRGVATAHTSSLIIVDIHPSYANDIPRYIRVIQSIASFETPVQQIQRIERLREELLNPETSQHAAFQLEAIGGRTAIAPLQQALNSPDIEVRFHAATALAYLGDGTPARVLAEIARVEPAFRVFALNALSVMRNDLDAEFHLQELLHVPSAETRYGAFRALRNRNPMDQTIRGEFMGGQFWYHGINSPTAPMVHITAQRHPEIVLFGTDIFLRQPFTLDAGPLIFVNGQTPNVVVVTRFATAGGLDERRTVSNRLDEVIRAVVDMGGTYPDVVQMLRQADMMGVLSCRLEIDCLPESNRIFRRSVSSSESNWMRYEEEEQSRSFWDRINPRNIFAPNPGERSSDFTGSVNTSSRD